MIHRHALVVTSLFAIASCSAPTGHATTGVDAGSGAGSGSNPDAPSGSVSTEYAPYFYTWGWGSGSYAFPSLVAMTTMGGPAAVTIAFVLSDGGACRATTDVQANLDDVHAFVAAGGHVKASFGGADGEYLESACSDASSLAAAISAWVTATGVTDLDFDIEQGSATSNPTINTRRAMALKQVQDSQHIRVAFTLPVDPDGLDDLGKAVVQSATDAGVAISFVNVMTMDYGAGQASSLGDLAIGSADATAHQLVSIIPGLALADAYRHVGVTPMIGTNDDGNVFSLDDARALVAWAAPLHLGLFAFWAIQRDETCPGATDLDRCTGVNGATFEFNAIFAGGG